MNAHQAARPPGAGPPAASPLLRLATAGSVDDGKSTLIGRLLYDSKSILSDQLAQVADASRRRHGEGVVDLSLLTDGLRAEREQGITIDVAYRYFATPRRTFILADTPGHVQYTRNMVTGASKADLAIVLIDARHGVVEQTRRHTFIAALLGIPHLVVAVNKMDLVDWSETRFDPIVRDFSTLRASIDAPADVRFVPISALHGDNVVDRSASADWYDGPALLEMLETVDAQADGNAAQLRFPVQWVIRVGGHQTEIDPDYRGYAGQLSSGVVRQGDRVVVLPSGHETTVTSIDTADGPLEEAVAPLSVTLRLADDLDVSRGDLICHADDCPELSRDFAADVCWMSERPLRPGRTGSRYLLKHATHTSEVIVGELTDRVDIATLRREPAPPELGLNDIGAVRIRTRRPLAFDAYAVNRGTGRFILIDAATNDTVAGGMIRG